MNFQKNIVYMLKNSFFFVEMLKLCGNIDYKGENFSYERIDKRELLKQGKSLQHKFCEEYFFREILNDDLGNHMEQGGKQSVYRRINHD